MGGIMMDKDFIIKRLTGLIEYGEAVKEDLELDKNEQGVTEWELDIKALKEALQIIG
jgi:hypothetical protein